MHYVKKICSILLLGIVLSIFLVFIFEAGARFCYEKWSFQYVQSKMERKKLEGTIDTIYCGNSLTYCSYHPDMIDQALGTNSFNLATGVQPYICNYYLIRDAAEKNPIENVYLTIALSSLKTESEAKNYISGLDNMISWNWKLKFLKDVNQKDVWLDALFYSNKVTNYFDFKEVKENVLSKLEKKKAPNYIGRGYRKIQGEYIRKNTKKKKNNKNNVWKAKEGERQIQEESLVYLEKIAAFCKEKKIKLSLVVMPYTQDYLDGAKDLDEFHQYVKQKSEEWNAEYYNFMLYKDRKKVFTSDKFKDKRHMNEKGSEAFCKLFIEVLQSENPQQYFYESMEEFER